MSKERKVPVKDIDRVMKENFKIEPAVVTWGGLEIKVKRTIGLANTIAFVSGVSDLCFSGGFPEYHPSLKDFGFKSNILEYYTNIRLSSDVEKRHDLIYNTDIVDVVKKHINKEQLDEIWDAIEEKVDREANSNIEAINNQLATLDATVKMIEDELSNAYASISDMDINSLVDVMGGEAIDEKKLVEAYIEHGKERDGSVDGVKEDDEDYDDYDDEYGEDDEYDKEDEDGE